MTSLHTSTGHDQATRLRSLVRALRTEPQTPIEPPERERDEPRAIRPIPTGIAQSSPPERAIKRPATPVVAIASGKGGVGKTVVAVNLSIALARAGRSVTLIDADLGAANADIMLGVRVTRRLDATLCDPRPLHALLSDTESGLRLIAGAVGTRRMDAAPDSLYGRLCELDGHGDVIVIDLPAGLDPLVIETCARADHALIVTTPEPTAIADAYATVKAVMARRASGECTPVQKMEVVVNQAVSPDIARRAHERLAMVALRFLARRLVLAQSLPIDPLVPRSIIARRPLLTDRSESPWSLGVEALGGRLIEGFGAMDARLLGI